MSNSLAIATVTAVLRDMLQEAAGTAVPGATVTTRRPEAVKDGGQNKPIVNIFLYLVNPNPAWRNTDITIRYPNPERLEKRPQSPLDLSYLISFYGNELELEPQRLLGSVVSAIHARPRLSPQAIRSTVERENYLRDSDLEFQVAQIENITLTPIGLSLEELSKLWSVFFQVPYALSVAYQASTVLIESATAPQQVKLVEEVHTSLPPDDAIFPPPKVEP
jgi:hypothetical protein